MTTVAASELRDLRNELKDDIQAVGAVVATRSQVARLEAKMDGLVGKVDALQEQVGQILEMVSPPRI